MTQVNMREIRTWWGGKKFVMDDTDAKPKTLAEEEEERIASFSFAWFRLSLIPSAAMFLFFLWPVENADQMTFGYPGSAFFMFVAVAWMCNVPNLVFMLIRIAALWFVTAGR